MTKRHIDILQVSNVCFKTMTLGTFSFIKFGLVVPVLVLLFVALWFILRGGLLYVFPCVILFLCFSVLLVLRLPRLGKRKLILVLFVRLFGLSLFRFKLNLIKAVYHILTYSRFCTGSYGSFICFLSVFLSFLMSVHTYRLENKNKNKVYMKVRAIKVIIEFIL